MPKEATAYPVTALTDRTEKLAMLGRRTIEIRVHNRRMRARDRKLLNALRINLFHDAFDLKEALLKVDREFMVSYTEADIDAEISKL